MHRGYFSDTQLPSRALLLFWQDRPRFAQTRKDASFPTSLSACCSNPMHSKTRKQKRSSHLPTSCLGITYSTSGQFRPSRTSSLSCWATTTTLLQQQQQRCFHSSALHLHVPQPMHIYARLPAKTARLAQSAEASRQAGAHAHETTTCTARAAAHTRCAKGEALVRKIGRRTARQQGEAASPLQRAVRNPW